MKPQATRNPGMRPQDWNPTWWEDTKHGLSWERIKEALKRDWAQTKADVSPEGRTLNQSVIDTVKQATGNAVIPPDNQPNQPTTPPRRDWDEAELAIRYGVGARAQYGARYAKWNDELEVRLSTEWDEDKTGRPFKDARSEVLIGWQSTS